MILPMAFDDFGVPFKLFLRDLTLPVIVMLALLRFLSNALLRLSSTLMSSSKPSISFLLLLSLLLRWTMSDGSEAAGVSYLSYYTLLILVLLGFLVACLA